MLVSGSVALPVLTAPAAAQEVIRRLPDRERGWSLFDVFRPSRPRDPVVRRVPDPNRPVRAQEAQPRKPKTRVVARPASAPAAAAAAARPTEPEKAIVEKKPDARVVMVVGDFMAGGLAEALQSTFAENANVRVLDRSQGSSGFVRKDVYDWPAQIAGLMDADKPAAVVIMMGSNDRQGMSVNGQQQQPRSDAWDTEYKARTSALAEAIEARNIPLLWVAVPAFKPARMTSDMLAFNTIYKSAVEGGGGQFVDIWDGFVDENGEFVTTGPDVNGQPVRLRGRDGINLTTAGKEKVAFYVEKPLRRMLGESEDNEKPVVPAPTLPEGPKAPIAVDRTDPIAMDDPGPDTGSDLLGGPGTVLPGDPSANASAPTGRADSFQPAASSPSPATPVVQPEPGGTALNRPAGSATPAAVVPQ